MKPKILVRGTDPNCVHNEHIDEFIGTCRKCGQVRDYSHCQEKKKNNFLIERGRQGGKAYAAVHSD